MPPAARNDGIRNDHLSEPSQRVADRQHPEEQRRLVLVEIAAHARKQPLAGGDHVARDGREARLVRRPGIADADAGADDDEQRERQPQQIAARGSAAARQQCLARGIARARVARGTAAAGRRPGAPAR